MNLQIRQRAALEKQELLWRVKNYSVATESRALTLLHHKLSGELFETISAEAKLNTQRQLILNGARRETPTSRELSNTGANHCELLKRHLRFAAGCHTIGGHLERAQLIKRARINVLTAESTALIKQLAQKHGLLDLIKAKQNEVRAFRNGAQECLAEEATVELKNFANFNAGESR